MNKSKYDKYVVYAPKKSAPGAPFPSLTLMSDKLVPGCNVEIMLNWITTKLGINPDKPLTHAHNYDEMIINIGADPCNPEDLGGEVVGFLGDEKHTLNKTSAVFVPKNVKHGVAAFNRLDRPYIQMAIKLSGKKNKTRKSPRSK
jgi:hypothetical protein